MKLDRLHVLDPDEIGVGLRAKKPANDVVVEVSSADSPAPKAYLPPAREQSLTNTLCIEASFVRLTG